ncbi:PadR family transcriptional regulator [Clostridium hydrogeniformans]|uniref:PadR family transcriptional regulator n=1 Tax=Clostridium hydrogeniformans TaxID=349933 RepID=UPI0004865F71|nr:PadR family transcriptional regulator [Clostridium hydrogeniformans]
MGNSTQILKGLLEGCILKIIKDSDTYGYEICESLINYGFEEVSEGSVYPILIRLEKKNIIYSSMKKSPLGPMRKYYYLTKEGESELINFISSWDKVKNSVNKVLEG